MSMSDVTASYGMPIDFIAFFKEFSYIIDDYSSLKGSVFTKLAQIVYLINTHFDYLRLKHLKLRHSEFFSRYITLNIQAFSLQSN